MYSNKRQYLGYFGDILSRSQVLEVGQKYTFTFLFPWYAHEVLYPSSSDAIIFLGASLYGAANVISASRALGSKNYVVTIIPTAVSLTVEDFVSAFSEAWKGASWYVPSPTFVQAEEGATSTKPGGIQEFVSEITEPIGAAVGVGVGNIIKPLLPYILLFGVGYVLLFTGIPKKLIGGTK